MADPVSDQVLTVLRQVEIDLEALVQPTPDPSNLVALPTNDPGFPAWVSVEDNIDAYTIGKGAATSNLLAVQALLTALYKIDFVREIGTSLPVLLNRVRDLLRDLADKLGPPPEGVLGGGLDIPSAVAGLTTFLTAIQKLPGSPPELTKVGDVLTQITGLLEDIPSTRLELYRIAQQIEAFSNTFANPGP